MKETTRLENYQVEIHRRSRQRTMRLRVRPDGSLQVNCNRGMPIREIRAFINESQVFIQKRVLEYEQKSQLHPRKTYVEGERFLFFGRELPLRLVASEKRAKVSVLEDALELRASPTATVEARRAAMHKFFKSQAALHFYDRIQVLERRMELYPAKLFLRGQRTRWGSCSSDRVITMNWKLLAAPTEVIDYVVVHELAHLEHMNHSPKFWALVAKHCPDYQHFKKWLHDHQFIIGQQFA